MSVAARADILIVGQGLAGTLLGWELERAGLSFAIADPQRGDTASAIAAGIVSPITGRRLVRSWRIDSLLPAARATYREIESALGVALWREMRIHRRFADQDERETFARKTASGDLAPFVEGAGDEQGFWIRGAGRVDFPALLAASREHWRQTGRFAVRSVAPSEEVARHAVVIDCSGVETVRDDATWRFVPWESSKGEMLEVRVSGLEPDVILNRREWIIPIAPDVALVGATHEPGVNDREPSVRARERLETAGRDLIGNRMLEVMNQRAGVRVNLPDRRPVAGRHPRESRFGLINALGAKGALWAPLLAKQWANHLARGAPFDAEIDVKRFV